MYDDFYKTASKAKAPIVPTKNFKSSLQAYIKLIDDGAIKIGKKGKTLDTPQKDALYNYAKSALRIPNNINANQYRALVNDIRKFSMKSQKEGFDLKALTGWKSGLEKDLNILSTPGYASKRIDPTLAAEIAKKLKFANKVYAIGLENSIVVKIGKDKVKLSPTIGIKKFDTPIAKKFKMVDKNIFGAGFERQGSITADQLGNTLLKSSNLTPQLLDDLKGLVGKKQYDRFVRQVFQKAYNKSVVTTREGGMNGLMFDPHKFEDLIGLTTKDGRALVKEMLKDSPLTLQKLDDFFAVAKNHAGLKIPDVSSFVARRATLGGTKSIFGGVAMGYSTFNNPIRSLGVVYLARKGSGILNNPKILDDVMTVMDYNAPGYKIYNSALKLIDGLLSENEQKNMRQTEINGLTEYKEFILENKDKILKGMTDE